MAAEPRAAALSIRPLQVLKVAILAEKYAVDYTWYVDTILNLIRIAGDYVSEEVWYRVIQIVINRDDVQGYAAKTVFEVWPRRTLRLRRGILVGIAGLPVPPTYCSGGPSAYAGDSASVWALPPACAGSPLVRGVCPWRVPLCTWPHLGPK